MTHCSKRDTRIPISIFVTSNNDTLKRREIIIIVNDDYEDCGCPS